MVLNYIIITSIITCIKIKYLIPVLRLDIKIRYLIPVLR